VTLEVVREQLPLIAEVVNAVADRIHHELRFLFLHRHFADFVAALQINSHQHHALLFFLG